MNFLLSILTLLTFEVSNPSDEYREQVVEIPLASVTQRIGEGNFRVLDAAGLEVPYQISYDGKLLVEAGVRKGGVARFTIARGTPRQFPTVCYGAIHPERKDDIAWENDRGSYRVYGPALERTGERSFGIDVWTKNTPELVNDDRYFREDVMNLPRVNHLRHHGLRREADSLYRTESYHFDHGRGLDPYKVGATLGCGAPALLLTQRGGKSSSVDSIVMPYCFEDYEILDVGPLRFTVRLDQSPRVVQGDTIREHRIIQLDKGSNFCRMTVWYDGLKRQKGRQPALCSGVVIQKEAPSDYVLADNYVSYTDPTDKPDIAQAPLYVAALFPEGDVQTRMLTAPQSAKGAYAGHALGVVGHYDGQPYSYYFGSAWAKYDIRTPQEWEARIKWFLRGLAEPLQLSIHE